MNQPSIHEASYHVTSGIYGFLALCRTVEFNQLLHSINTLSPEQMRQLSRELESKLAATTHASQPAADPLLGSMSDHAELMDQIVEDAMRHREHQPWRLTAGE